MQNQGIRIAKHAGSWYLKQKQALNKQLQQFLDQASCTLKNIKTIKAIIGPHAGYTYSGPTAAWCYKYLATTKPKRVFLLGPSHHLYLQGCSITTLNIFQTPIGNIEIDIQTVQKLKSKGEFKQLTKKNQQAQHSIEMHLPYINKIFGSNIKLIPIIVGNIDSKKGQYYGKLLAPYFDDQNTIFIISSDFCHWGAHFEYQPQQQGIKIWEGIQKLDKNGMHLIQNNNIKDFDKYIKKTGNTICGQNPIRILMHTIAQSKHKINTTFVKYDQSSKVQSKKDSSVSYASSISYIAE